MKKGKSDLVTVADIQNELECKHGIDLSVTAFRFYQWKGLIPQPQIKTRGEKGRGVFGFYHPAVIDVIRAVKKLQETGFTLAEIKNFLRSSHINEYINLHSQELKGGA